MRCRVSTSIGIAFFFFLHIHPHLPPLSFQAWSFTPFSQVIFCIYQVFLVQLNGYYRRIALERLVYFSFFEHLIWLHLLFNFI